jgi:hypothetical protein
MKIATFTFCVLSTLLAGCAHDRSTVTPATAQSLPGLVGQRTTLIGIAEPRKIGAALRCEGFEVWIDGLHDWPPDCTGHRVQVVGVLEDRHDLPVIVADTPEERGRLQGIPVPSGTDLHEASRRYIIRDARWKVIP